MPLFSKPVLALDTAAGACACLLLADGTSATATMDTPRAHSRELLPILQGLLAGQGLTWQDIGAFAVGIGPGSFTGLRVACATIAGINASLKKPVYSLSSLAITAEQTDTTQNFWVLEDARSGLVYAAQYAQGRCLTAPQCLTWETLLSFESSSYITLSPMPVELLGWQALALKFPREQALLKMVQQLQPETPHAFWVEPMYLQLSQAEKNLA